MPRPLDAMPLLASAVASMPPDHFSGVEVVYVNHLISDSLMVARALADRGASLSTVGLPYGRTDGAVREAVVHGLAELGPVRIPDVSAPLSYATATRATVAEALRAAADGSDRPILVVEDGGYAVPLLHDDPDLAEVAARCTGAVEHTTRGRLNDEYLELDDVPRTERRLSFPVVTIAASQLKSAHEPPFVGQAIVDELTYLLRRRHQFLRYRDVVLLGYGRIGRGIAAALAAQGAAVTVVDPDPDLAAAAYGAGFAAAPELTAELLHRADLVIGATGMPSVSARHVDWFLDGPRGELVLASGSSKQIELAEAMAALDARPGAARGHDPDLGTWWDVGSRRITALADGYPVIFFPAHTNGAPNLAMDPVMTQLFLAACLLRANADRLPAAVHHVDGLRERHPGLRCGPWDDVFDAAGMLERWCLLVGLEPADHLARVGLRRG